MGRNGTLSINFARDRLLIVVRDLIADSREARDREIEQETDPKRRQWLIEQRDRFVRESDDAAVAQQARIRALEEAQDR